MRAAGTPKVLSALMFRSNMNPSKLEWATLPLNSRNLRSTRPGGLADLRAFELTVRVLRQGQPETCRVGTRGHVVAVDVVRIGDPESRHRVVRRQQDVLGVLAGRLEVQAVRASLRTGRGWSGRRAWTYDTWSGSPGCGRTGCRARCRLRGRSSDRRCCRSRCSRRCRLFVPCTVTQRL